MSIRYEKKLNELYNVESDVLIKDIKINSKQIEPGDMFVCTMGVNADRHDYIDESVKAGASAIIVSRDGIEKDVPIIKVCDTNHELTNVCQKFYDYPHEKLKMIGITGTDGKTSTASIVQTLIGQETCGYIGTNGRSWANKIKDDNPNTTPDATLLYKFLREFLDDGCKYAVMEASSEAFFRGRLENLEYDVSVYTNITAEHLNIHGNFENYKECKKHLFRQTKKDGYCILNRDDEFFEEIKKECKGHVLSYGRHKDATLQIESFKVFHDKTLINLIYNDKLYKIKSPMLGDFNVWNLAAAILVCLSLGLEFEKVIKNIVDIKVSGRLEVLDTKTPYFVIVDFAHTPNGIEKVLNFANSLNVNKSIVVIGSAGERDYLKRPLMGKIVLDNASYAIFTSDDPRSEEPLDIIDMMISDVKDTYSNYEIVIDRRKAIERAINIAEDNDIVLVLGKGSETCQKLKNEIIYFKDIEECYRAVKLRETKEKVA